MKQHDNDNLDVNEFYVDPLRSQELHRQFANAMAGLRETEALTQDELAQLSCNYTFLDQACLSGVQIQHLETPGAYKDMASAALFIKTCLAYSDSSYLGLFREDDPDNPGEGSPLCVIKDTPDLKKYEELIDSYKKHWPRRQFARALGALRHQEGLRQDALAQFIGVDTRNVELLEAVTHQTDLEVAGRTIEALAGYRLNRYNNHHRGNTP